MTAPPLTPTAPQHPKPHQRGASLIIVLLVLVLVGLTALSASRTALFNESITGNEADYSRALAAAEAMINDARLDILGTCPPANCRPVSTGALPDPNNPFMPDDKSELSDLITALADNCVKGLCAPSNYPTSGLAPNFWADKAALGLAKQKGPATYGLITGATPGTTGNPLLLVNSVPMPKAWYWIEAIHFDESACIAWPTQCTNRPDDNIIFRITAVAEGNRSGTVAGIQTYFVRHPVPPSP